MIKDLTTPMLTFNPSPGNGFFATSAGNGGGGEMPPPQAYLEF